MEKQFCSYEIALKLKELGFDEECLAWYGSEDIFEISGNYKNSTHTFTYCVSAPLYQQVIGWFREKYYLWIEITPYDFEPRVIITHKEEGELFAKSFKTYYEAREQAILEAIELCQREK